MQAGIGNLRPNAETTFGKSSNMAKAKRTKTKLKDFLIIRDPRWKSDWRYKVKPLIEDGLTYKEVAKKCGVHLTTIHDFLRQQGVISHYIRRNSNTQVFETVNPVYKNARN